MTQVSESKVEKKIKLQIELGFRPGSRVSCLRFAAHNLHDIIVLAIPTPPHDLTTGMRRSVAWSVGGSVHTIVSDSASVCERACQCVLTSTTMLLQMFESWAGQRGFFKVLIIPAMANRVDLWHSRSIATLAIAHDVCGVYVYRSMQQGRQAF